MKKKLLAAILVCIICVALFTGCKKDTPEEPEEILPTTAQTPEPVPQPAPTQVITPTPIPSPEPPPEEPGPHPRTVGTIVLSTATSAKDSGLLDFLLPKFTAETGWAVDVFSVGAEAALQMGREGSADVLLINSRADEDQFIADGYGDNRYDVMHNDFIVVGPKNGFLTLNDNAKETFKAIIESGLGFVSRGDNSGTHKKEQSIWESLGVNPEGNPLYISIGQGMGITLGITRELNIYTLADRATWLNFAEKGELEIVCEGDAEMLNSYSVIAVSASVSEYVNAEGGRAFVDWITGPSGQELIGQYGVEKSGQQMFIPDANRRG